MSIILAIDAGHGGKDPGALDNGIKEKDIVLDVAKRALNYLKEHYPEIDPRLTRDSDKFVELGDRTDLANGWKADAFVSIHVNGASAKSANGYESYIYLTDDENSKSYALQKQLDERLALLWMHNNRKNRGSKKANYHVLRKFKGASVLVELGFITNSKDAELLKYSGFIQENAECIGEAIAEYFGLKKDKTVCKDNKLHRVIVEGKQLGAYNEISNVLQQVEQSLKSGKSKIEIKST
ncbi:sporulation-specific N-acetylmuramoyl-L-alanine amidase [Vibrio phage PVP-XSN]|uniref:Sporulation-specific N-acetylmuramoyl-L-alanine amidase n=1 Tax=Vibrio phage PVP-XSN TaxID=3056214 RepID=A0AAX3Y6W0_9CAUD|nr:sporulation-specific N-acetylmuramoyl-L-alanine amidase [Vibrio phage PVP-XSN]